MRSLVDALESCPRAIFLHHATHGYTVTAIEGSLYADCNWHPTLEEACASFFGEVLDVSGFVFEAPHEYNPELESAEWWPSEHRGGFAQSLKDPWLRPFASLPPAEGAGGDGAPEPEVEVVDAPPPGGPGASPEPREKPAEPEAESA